KPQSVFLPVVAKIPNEITRPALPVQQTDQRLHSVTIDQNHTVIIYSYFNQGATTATQSAHFTPRPEGRGFLEQI
ncbi:MAG: hypothetical protein ACEQSK_20045, partial [Sphingomonadaceae bacterium]